MHYPKQLEQDESLWPNEATHCIDGDFIKWVGEDEYIWISTSSSWVLETPSWSLQRYKKRGMTVISRPTKPERIPEVGFKTIYWVAEVDNHGTPWNLDGPHETYEIAQNSIPLLKGLSKKDAKLIVTAMHFKPLKSERDLFVEEAVSVSGITPTPQFKEDIYGKMYDSGKFQLVDTDK